MVTAVDLRAAHDTVFQEQNPDLDWSKFPWADL